MLAPSVGDNEIAVKPANTKCSLVSFMLSGAVMVELVDPNVIQSQCSVKGGDLSRYVADNHDLITGHFGLIGLCQLRALWPCLCAPSIPCVCIGQR